MREQITLCIIAGNSERYIERFIRRFAQLVGKVVVVRAMGDQEPDDTLVIAERVCNELNVKFRCAGYRNGCAESWPHVDNFAAARQKAFDLAQTEWIFWADTDDVIDERSIAHIHAALAQAGHSVDAFAMEYEVPEDGLVVIKERLVRRGAGEWRYAVHEEFRFHQTPRIATIPGTRIVHAPIGDRKANDERNVRLLESMGEDMPIGHRFHLCNSLRAVGRTADAAKEIMRLLQEPELGAPERFELLMSASQLADADPAKRGQLILQAIGTDPGRREGPGEMVIHCLRCGKMADALHWARVMLAIPRPKEYLWNAREKYHGWLGVMLYATALRANGEAAEADRVQTAHLQAHGAKISLLHATRGRPKQAYECKMKWLDLAADPDSVEHLFVIDADDTDSIPLTMQRHVLIPPGGGCVAAWNTAAWTSQGAVMVQLSDDWTPPRHWDRLILERMGDLGKPKVLAVSDGHREDKLMCMAICNRAYFTQDQFLFHPAFLSMYSDNWFTELAYARGQVIEAKDLIFTHDHPAFNPSVPMDKTYAESNSQERYTAGLATLERLRTGADWSFVPGFFNYIPFYDYMADRIQDGETIAEVGVWLGRSICYLADALKRRGKEKVRILAVDHFKGELNQPAHEATVTAHGGSILEAFKANIAKCGVADMITIIQGDSADSAAQVENASLSFCYIDAAHDRASVRRDIRAWLPKIKADGIIAGHDAQHAEVFETVNEMIPGAVIMDPVWMQRIVTPLPPTPVLSILTPAIWDRKESADLLASTIAYESENGNVEHLVLFDDKTRSVGAKRQALLDSAKGDYIAFVDDDDAIHPGYIFELIEAAKSGPDVITFRQLAEIDGTPGFIIFDANQRQDEPWQANGTARRRPWHVCAWRRELVKDCRFGNCNYGEDRMWVDQAAPLVKTSRHIDKVLHTYRHSAETTAAPHPAQALTSRS